MLMFIGRPLTLAPQKHNWAMHRQLKMPAAGTTARPRPGFAGASPQQTIGRLGLRPQRTAVRPRSLWLRYWRGGLRPFAVPTQVLLWSASLWLVQGSPEPNTTGRVAWCRSDVFRQLVLLPLVRMSNAIRFIKGADASTMGSTIIEECPQGDSNPCRGLGGLSRGHSLRP